jgi:hypothetical protein
MPKKVFTIYGEALMISLKQALIKSFSPCYLLSRWLGGVAPIAVSRSGPFDFALICFAPLNLKTWEAWLQDNLA